MPNEGCGILSPRTSIPRYRNGLQRLGRPGVEFTANSRESRRPTSAVRCYFHFCRKSLRLSRLNESQSIGVIVGEIEASSKPPLWFFIYALASGVFAEKSNLYAAVIWVMSAIPVSSNTRGFESSSDYTYWLGSVWYRKVCRRGLRSRKFSAESEP
jgi:hypothetical protein